MAAAVADGESFCFNVWRHTDALAGYNYIDGHVRYMKERQPMTIWGLGLLHDALTEDATTVYVRHHPVDSWAEVDRMLEAEGEVLIQPSYEMLTAFTSLELAPWCRDEGGTPAGSPSPND